MGGNPNGNFQNTSIVEYLEKSFFATPDYQRAYSWKSLESSESKDNRIRYQVKEFWDDIIRWYKDERNSEKNYYLGTIVLSSAENDESNNGRRSGCENIVDGQQRIITLYLLYAALADWYRSKNAGKLYEDALRKILYVPKSDWDVGESKAENRLILSGDDKVHLDKILEFFKDSKYVCVESSCLEGESNIYRAFKFFKYSIQEFAEKDIDKNQVKVVAELDEYIEKHLYAAVVVTEDEIRAHAVFETLNDRGIPLGAEDLIKNYLFSRAGNNYKTVTQRWNDILKYINKVKEKADESTSDLSQFDKFIQSYMNSFSAPIPVGSKKNKKWVVDNSIFPCFKQWFKYRMKSYGGRGLSDEELVDLITREIEHAAHMYMALHSGDYWDQYLFEENEPVEDYINLIKLLSCINSMSQKNWYAHLYPLFFSVLSYIDKKKELLNQGNKKKRRETYKTLKDEVISFTDYIESYIFRAYIMINLGMLSSRMIRTDKFAGISQKIRDGEYDSLIDVFNEKGFEQCFSAESTSKFKEGFSTYCIYNTDNSSKNLPYKEFAKYILRKLENKHQEDNNSETRVVGDGSSSSLEHIFPFRYSKEKNLLEWKEFWNEELGEYYSDYVFRVGNYTILHYRPNGEASDKPWGKKREIYKKSKITHTVDIAEKYEAWTPKIVDEVQREQANEAIKVWSSPRDNEEA